MSNKIIDAEEKIDAVFKTNRLKTQTYAQAMWTLLSVAEDLHLKVTQIAPLSEGLLPAYIDNLLNTVTYPLRVCFSESRRTPKVIENSLNDEHYGWAADWLSLADHYRTFCSIFPMWHKQKIDIHFEGATEFSTNWSTLHPEYEAYNRLIHKDGKRSKPTSVPDNLTSLISQHISRKKRQFSLNLTPILIRSLIKFYQPIISERFTLPENWHTSQFTFGAFKEVFAILYAIASGRFIARVIVASSGMVGLGYPSAVWVVKKTELLLILKKYTNYDEALIINILEIITFGKAGVRNPDITVQPVVDLENGFYALSPLVLMHTNIERNLCVLLNQIDSERRIYSALTTKKEELLREEIQLYLEPLGLEIRHGKVHATDLDIAIIDRPNRACICLELKWFIEPAEIREITERSEELSKGIKQAQKIDALFRKADHNLISEVLKIDSDFHFIAVVGSRNWAGHFNIQDERTAIVKVWHLLEKIKECGSLIQTINWLKERKYLPVNGIDFEIQSHDVRCGEWKTTWYGVKPL